MGTSSSKSSSSSQTNSTQTTTPQETQYEKTINPLDVQLRQAMQEPLVGMFSAGSGDIMNLLGGQSLGGAYSGNNNGVGFGPGSSIYGVGPEAQQNIINQSMRGVPTSLQATGMLDSGASQALYQRGEQNVGAQLAQFNTQAQQNALGGAMSGIGQVSAPGIDLTSMLSQRLQSLRPVTTTGQTNSSTTQRASQTGSPIQDIAGLSSAFGTNSGLGNLMNGLIAQGGTTNPLGSLSSMFGSFGGQTAGNASLAGTTPGGSNISDLSGSLSGSAGSQGNFFSGQNWMQDAALAAQMAAMFGG